MQCEALLMLVRKICSFQKEVKGQGELLKNTPSNGIILQMEEGRKLLEMGHIYMIDPSVPVN